MVLLFSIGLGVVISLFSTYKESHESSRIYANIADAVAKQPPLQVACHQTKPSGLSCIIQQPDDKPIDAHTKADLKAQQDSAQWAFGTFLLSVCSLFLGIIGTIYIALTLIQSRAATNAAINAVVVTENASKDQSRAYVHVEKAELYWQGDSGENPMILLYVANVGQTPAKWFEIESCTFTSELNEQGIEINPISFEEISIVPSAGKRWNAIGGGGVQTCTDYREDEIESLALEYKNRANISVNIAGIVRYETFFGEIFESDFWFVRRCPPKYRIDHDQSRIIAGVNYRVERPCALSKAIGKLRSYHRIEI